MTKAKKLLALLLAVLTVVSFATLGVSAEDPATTPEAPSVEAQKTILESISADGCEEKLTDNKVTLTAAANVKEIKVLSDGVEWECVAPVEKDENGSIIISYDKFHYATKEDGTKEVTNKAEATATFDGKTYTVVFTFAGEDANGHRYDKFIEKVEPTYTSDGGDKYECICGAQGMKNRVNKLPGTVAKVNGGVDLSVAKKGTIKIEPKLEIIGEPKYTVTYKSSDEKIATVNEKGEVTGVAVGKAVITITVKDDAGKTVEDTVNVKVTYTLIQWILVAVEAIISGSVFVWDLILDALGLMK